jgi:sugar-specific transcriptional regulator TrmB
VVGDKLSQEKTLKTLESIGLTQIDAQIYLLLSKKGSQKAVDIARSLGTAKQTVYFSIKALQKSGIVTSTVERPARFNAVPFDSVLDLFIRTKMEEAERIKRDKDEIIGDWKSIAIIESKESKPKFTVIQGHSVVYAKIQQMVQLTSTSFSTILTIPNLLRTEDLGILKPILKQDKETCVNCRLLVIANEQNKNALKTLEKESLLLKSVLNVRIPDFSYRLSPMIIRDNEEAIFFIDTDTEKSKDEEICLWTNCKSIVKSLVIMFDDLWQNSIDLSAKVKELETGKQSPRTLIIKKPVESKEKYLKALGFLKKSILIMTSPVGLKQWWREKNQIAAWAKQGISVKLMAPITKETLSIAEELLQVCEVRHISSGYVETIIIDGQYLFQSNDPSKNKWPPFQENTYYSDDATHVKRIASMLENIWANSQTPSMITLRNIVTLSSREKIDDKHIDNEYRKIIGFEWIKKPHSNDKLNRITHVRNKIPDKEVGVLHIFGRMGCGVIYPKTDLDLPSFIIQAYQANEKSSFGIENSLLFFVQMKINEKSCYLPSAFVTDNKQGYNFRQKIQENIQTNEKAILVRKGEVTVQSQGNKLIAGWSLSIPLIPPKYILPPSYISFEGYGKRIPYYSEIIGPMNRRIQYRYSSMDAFVNFMYLDKLYSGPASDGMLQSNLNVISYPFKADK